MNSYERGAEHTGDTKHRQFTPLTQVSTEGHISSTSWYSTTVGPGWSEGIGSLSTV